MSIVTMVLGESGTGKSASLRHLPPAETLLIQGIAKPLPFRAKEWRAFHKERCPQGNIFASDRAETIIRLMQNTKRRVIVIDDFQYIMANEFMRRAKEKGYDKFMDIGSNAWHILNAAANLPNDKRVYCLSHTAIDENGRTKIKTIGKMLDEKITLEGMVTIVLRTQVQDGRYLFSTRNNGSDTTKAPMGLFESDFIDNDLAAVDALIADYYDEEELPTAPPALNKAPETLPDYPQEKLESLLPQWQQSGKSPEQIIAMVSSKYRLTDEQKAQILALADKAESQEETENNDATD